MARERDATGGGQPPAGSKEPPAPAALTDATPEFEEYTAPPRVDEHGRPITKSKGLRAQGYDFPPKEGMPQPPMTKANLAKGIGVPEIPRASPTSSASKSSWPLPPLPGMEAPASPPPEPKVILAKPDRPAPPDIPHVIKVAEDPLFEEYQRPGLRENPRTGKGLRTDGPPQPKAHEILARLKEPEIEVATPKRFGVMPMRDVPAPPPPAKATVETRSDTKDGKAAKDAAAVAAHEAAVADQASLDADADLAATSLGLTMSNPSRFGPPKTIVAHPEDEDIFAPHPEITPAVHGEDLPQVAPSPSLPVDQSPSPLPPPPSAHPPAAVPEPAPTIPSEPIRDDVSAAMQRIPEVPRQPTAVVVPTSAQRTGPAVSYHSPPAPAPSASDATATVISQPHTSGAPPVKPGGGTAPRIALLQSDYHFDVTSRMAESAKARAAALGATVVGHHHVPGVFDVPLAAKVILRQTDVDAIVVVGAVVQGETGHDVIIARETARKLADLAYEVEKPVGLGITGPGMSEEQAQARINNGAHAVDSVVQQHRLLVGLRA